MPRCSTMRRNSAFSPTMRRCWGSSRWSRWGLLEKRRREKYNTYCDPRRAIVSYLNDMDFETTEREAQNLQQGPTPMDICYAGYHRERETGGSGSSSEIRYGGFLGYHREIDGGGSGSSSYNSIPSGCQPDSWMDLEYLSAFLHTMKGKGKGKAEGKKGDSKSSSAKSQKGSNTPSTEGKGGKGKSGRAKLGRAKGMDNASLDVSSKRKTMTTPTSPCSRRLTCPRRRTSRGPLWFAREHSRT